MEKKRILVIDDEVDFTTITKMNLEETGEFEVSVANNGGLGVQLAKKLMPDLILLDVLMPEVDGGMVAATLDRDATTRNIPVVFVTAAAKKDEVEARGGTIGKHPFIAKPVSVEELLERVRSILK